MVPLLENSNNLTDEKKWDDPSYFLASYVSYFWEDCFCITMLQKNPERAHEGRNDQHIKGHLALPLYFKLGLFNQESFKEYNSSADIKHYTPQVQTRERAISNSDILEGTTTWDHE
ncbi:hypothetical protein SAY87_004178 [Trapa incisa]|uniref:Uncharacterized protein n=1 Tax=Trapa incisa TaxID=236973 RepID=A0AAN7JNE3_9MYRT|nr:hypothetical protein SAY87_004178 [Trapa incisa]